MSESNKFKLDDSTISHIVRLIQLGLLQGLDVVDYFRQIELVADKNGRLSPEEEYLIRHEKEIKDLIDSIPAAISEVSESYDETEEE
jgi:hypothetical protein